MIPSDDVLAFAELYADAVFSKIPEERYRYYVDGSMNAGYEAARRFSGMSASELAEELGVPITIEEKSSKIAGVSLRAQTRTENGRTRIIVYRESLDLLAMESAWEDFEALDADTVLSMHLFHELFHVIEERERAYVSDSLDSVRIWKLFSHERKSRVMRTSEIAAHRFAEQMLSLPWMPNFYDYIYLVRTKKLREDDMNAFFSRIDKLFEGKNGGKT